MGDPTDEFFARLEERGPEVLPPRIRGTIRFDLSEDGQVDHWFVSMNRGNVLVSHEMREADCVVNTEKRLFDQFATGAAHLLTSYNRNDVAVEGQLALLLAFRRAFPSPPGTLDPRERIRARTGGRAGPGRRFRPGSPGGMERRESRQ